MQGTKQAEGSASHRNGTNGVGPGMRSCLWGDVEGVAGRALSGWKRLSQRGEERKVEQLVFVILVLKKLRRGIAVSQVSAWTTLKSLDEERREGERKGRFPGNWRMIETSLPYCTPLMEGPQETQMEEGKT